MSSTKHELMECRLCQQKGHLINDCPGLYDPEKSAVGLAKLRDNTDYGYCHGDTEKLPKLKHKNPEDKAKPLRPIIVSEESKFYR